MRKSPACHTHLEAPFGPSKLTSNNAKHSPAIRQFGCNPVRGECVKAAAAISPTSAANWHRTANHWRGLTRLRVHFWVASTSPRRIAANPAALAMKILAFRRLVPALGLRDDGLDIVQRLVIGGVLFRSQVELRCRNRIAGDWNNRDCVCKCYANCWSCWIVGWFG